MLDQIEQLTIFFKRCAAAFKLVSEGITCRQFLLEDRDF